MSSPFLYKKNNIGTESLRLQLDRSSVLNRIYILFLMSISEEVTIVLVLWILREANAQKAQTTEKNNPVENTFHNLFTRNKV